MVEISPFKGITYNKEKIQNLDKVMSPPYDIISENMQTTLYEKDPYNFVRLILGKQYPEDSEENNRYTRASELFNDWLQKSILVPSEKCMIYPYKIDYKLDNKSKTMNGFFVLLKLDSNYKYVKAHERTLSKPKADRLNLMKACNAHLEPIQLLYIDDNDFIRKTIDETLNNPMINVKGYDGFTHRLWKLENKEVINEIINDLKDKTLFIADGHHRYQTAINFANEKIKSGESKKDSPFNYQMVILANMYDEGLAILPTHRFIKMPNVDIKDLINRIEKYFTVEEFVPINRNPKETSEEIINKLKTEDKHKFAMHIKNKYYILTLKDEKVMDKFASEKSKTWRTLDVSILHKIILEHIMGIDESNLEDHIKYTRVDSETIEFVDKDKFDMSFLMNATKIEQLRKIAEAGEHMPQKSTYFLPKMLSGLVMYKMQ